MLPAERLVRVLVLRRQVPRPSALRPRCPRILRVQHHSGIFFDTNKTLSRLLVVLRDNNCVQTQCLLEVSADVGIF